MYKLFSMEDLPEEEPTLSYTETDMGAVLQGSDFSEELEDIVISSDIVTESIELYANQITMASRSAIDLKGRKLGSVDYLVSVENYKVITDALTENLGIKKFMPSLEDFSSKYALEASHKVAMEGFIDFIKNIWQKIKNFFLAFFKKISQFIKRLSGANLEIDSYEKYVDDLIRKIKKNKLVLGDNKAQLESRLPALMANLGVDKFTEYDQVLNQSTRRMNKLALVLKGQYNPGLIKRTEDSLKNIRDFINDALEEATKKDISKDKVVAKLATVKSELREALAAHYLSGGVSESNTPREVKDAILDISPNVVFKDVTVLSLVDPTKHGDELPKHFNAFLAMDTSNKSFITTHTETNDYISNTIPPIGNIESMEEFHKTYKEFVKAYNVKESSNLLTKLEKSITETINFMLGKYATTVNIVENNFKTQDKVLPFSGSDLYEGIKYLFNFPKEYTKGISDPKERLKVLKEIYEHIKTEYEHFLSIMGSGVNQLQSKDGELPDLIWDFVTDQVTYAKLNKNTGGPGLLSAELLEGKLKTLSLTGSDYTKFVNTLIQALQLSETNGLLKADELGVFTGAIVKKLNFYLQDNSQSVQGVDPKELLDELADIQNVVLPFLNTFKSHIVATATSLTSIYTESRAASIKYIYDSARLYH